MASISLKYKSKQGSLTAPGDVDPGAMIPIQTITVGAGGTSSVAFTSIPQNYEHLQVRLITRSTYTASWWTTYVVPNNDTSTVYSSHYLIGNGSTVSASANTSQFLGEYAHIPAASASANMFGVAVIDILDYSNTSKNKTIRSLFGYDLNGSGEVGLNSALFGKTDAITSLYFGTASNFAQYSSFTLYGIKRAGA